MTSRKQSPVIILTHKRLLPSFRYRIAPLITELASRGIECTVIELTKKRIPCISLLRYARQIRQAPLVILHKLRIPVPESHLIHALNRNTIFDVDDAIDMRQPRWAGDQIRPSRTREIRFDTVIRKCRLVIAGNEVLAGRLRTDRPEVLILPTGVDLHNYPQQQIQQARSTAVWVGLPSNLRYLEMIRPALVSISQRFPDFRLRIISSKAPEWSDVKIEFVEWSPESEKQALSSSGFGIMPLSDDPYSAGKCAFKLLQYMASSLPCIASPVGANNTAVVHGVTGFLASSCEEWEQHMAYLLEQPAFSASAGQAGRQRADEHYNQLTLMSSLADRLQQEFRLI